MKHKQKGFTLIEVALFLAITGVLFVGIIIGTSNSIAGQRFFDATQNFAEFLRSAYSQVTNPQGIGNGRSDQAIYGKMISFGQSVDLSGNTIPNGEQQIFTYDIVGDATASGSDNISTMLESINATIVDKDGVPLGIAESYIPHWGSQIQTTDNEAYKGTILIVRHPRSGTIMTLSNKTVYEVNNTESQNNLADVYRGTTEAIDFCVNPNPEAATEKRYNVRIAADAHNGSAVEIIDLDSEQNACNK